MTRPDERVEKATNEMLDTFANNFTATWTLWGMDYIQSLNPPPEQLTFTTLWVTNSTDNQQYVAYALAVIETA